MVWRLFVDYESHRFKTRFNASEELKQKLHEAYDFKITQGREKDPNYLDSIVSTKELLKERFDFEF
jgi:hypothetical protein